MILGLQNDLKNHENLVIWASSGAFLAVGGRIFEILGDFLRGLIFDEFSIGEKSAENRAKWRAEAVRRTPACFLREGSAALVWPVEAFGV